MLRKYYVIFVYILQGKMGKMEKNRKKITQLKWSKCQRPKDENMGWTKHKSVCSMYDKRISGTFLYLFFWVICTSINCIPKHYFDFCLFVSTINNHYFWFIGKNRQMTAATFGLVGGQIDLKKCQKWPNIGQKCLWSQEGLTGGFCSSLGFFFP